MQTGIDVEVVEYLAGISAELGDVVLQASPCLAVADVTEGALRDVEKPSPRYFRQGEGEFQRGFR